MIKEKYDAKLATCMLRWYTRSKYPTTIALMTEFTEIPVPEDHCGRQKKRKNDKSFNIETKVVMFDVHNKPFFVFATTLRNANL